MSIAGQLTMSSQVTATLMRMNIVGAAPEFVRCCESIARVAKCDACVLIEGETGTGKELFARAAHYLGPRANYPFVAVNCGALPNDLVENELFGHCAGAYTGASHEQPGLVREAERGTLFLDEIEAISPKGQTSLLRFIEHHEYRRLGDSKLQTSTARIVAASNMSLTKLVQDGSFRRDLYYRLSLLTLRLPSLRARRGDIDLLCAHFLDKYGAHYGRSDLELHPDTTAWMQNYDWPGSVRELENLIHRALLLTDDSIIRIEQPEATGEEASSADSTNTRDELLDHTFSNAKAETIKDFEKRYLIRLMARTHGNITLAARYAGKERSALGKLIKRHRIDRSLF